ncbi:hypothetical protein FS837_004635 [Tulasnella sp. UAMH 9824]|nr:hypothetical protein FS837_004635 [Tulasnella sp. UAMH 9824]
MSSEKATRNPPKYSVIENALAMLVESIQEQNCVAARNALVPMHRLSSEVLALILLESLDFENGFCQKALRSLAQFAHRWWEIIKSQSRFWTCVVWPGDDMALSIRKARTLPLQLLARNGRHPRSTDLQQNIKSLLRAHADRWFKISIVSDWGRVSRLFSEVLERSAFSRLEILKMVGVSRVFHVELGRLERLREAWLSFIPCRGHGPDPTNLAPLLTCLFLKISRYKAYPVSCLASFLRHCSNLQELDILDLSNFENEDEDDTQIQPPSFISLPALRSLSIEHTAGTDASPDVQILGLIRSPNLANFKINYYHLDPDPDAEAEGDVEGIDAVGVFRVLRDSSQFESDALPMSSAVRNIGDSVYLGVVFETSCVQVRAESRGAPGSRPVDLQLSAFNSDIEDFSRDILPYLTCLDIPIELTSLNHLEQGGWGHILDRFRNVTPNGGPRASGLETLKLRDQFGYVSWTADIHEMPPRIAEMLEKRRELFKSAGMVWPSEFRVITDYYIFNEDEGIWIQLEKEEDQTHLEEEEHHSHMV